MLFADCKGKQTNMNNDWELPAAKFRFCCLLQTYPPPLAFPPTYRTTEKCIFWTCLWIQMCRKDYRLPLTTNTFCCKTLRCLYYWKRRPLQSKTRTKPSIYYLPFAYCCILTIFWPQIQPSAHLWVVRLLVV